MDRKEKMFLHFRPTLTLPLRLGTRQPRSGLNPFSDHRDIDHNYHHHIVHILIITKIINAQAVENDDVHQGLRKHRNHVRGFETAQHGDNLSRAGKGPHPEETRMGEYIMSLFWRAQYFKRQKVMDFF